MDAALSRKTYRASPEFVERLEEIQIPALKECGCKRFVKADGKGQTVLCKDHAAPYIAKAL